MPRPIDLTGRKFSRLTAIRIGEPSMVAGKLRRRWLCVCECGQETTVATGQLTNGTVRSCGCLCRDVNRQAHLKHGLSETTEFGIWTGMLTRCYNPNCKAFKNYGGRGISICDRWKTSFENFLADMGLRPSKAYSIDRINNDGNYEPVNCRWATAREQRLNARRPGKRAA